MFIVWLMWHFYKKMALGKAPAVFFPMTTAHHAANGINT